MREFLQSWPIFAGIGMLCILFGFLGILSGHESFQSEQKLAPIELGKIHALFPNCIVAKSQNLLLRAWIVNCPDNKPFKVLTWMGEIDSVEK